MDNRSRPTSSLPTSSGRSLSKPRQAGQLIDTRGDTTALINRLSKPENARPAIPALEGDQHRLIAGVFARMKSIYGHLWSSNFRDENQLRLAQIDWFRAIHRAGLTTGDVNATLDHLADKVVDMPNLPGFLALCRAVRDRRQRERERAELPPLLPETDEQAAARKARQAQEVARYRDTALAAIQGIKQACFNNKPPEDCD